MSDIVKKYYEDMSEREIMNSKFPKTKTLKDKLDEFVDDEVNQTISIFEEEYPELSEEFKKIQSEMYEMFARKHMDYGLNNIALGGDLKNEADKKFSLTGLAIRLTDKISRLKNLLTNVLLFKSKFSPGLSG